MYILMAFLAGGIIVTSRTLNAKLGEKRSIMVSTFFNYFVGLLVSIVVLLIVGEKTGAFTAPKTFLNYAMYFGGIIGVVNITLLNYITPKISAFYLTMFVFVSQLFTGMFLDYIRFQELSIGKIIGGLLILAGLFYNLNLDRKKENEIS